MMLVVLLGLACSAVLVAACAAIAEILAAEMLPPMVRAVWAAAVIALPGIGAVIWYRMPRGVRTGAGLGDALAARVRTER